MVAKSLNQMFSCAAPATPAHAHTCSMAARLVAIRPDPLAYDAAIETDLGCFQALSNRSACHLRKED